MEQYTEIISLIALVFGASWASGINLYATILTLGLMNNTGYIDLPEQLTLISDPIVLLAAGGMFVAEFIIDKVPGADNAWDSIHSFIRIPFGAYMAFGVAGEQGVALATAAAIVGGGLTAATHATKSGTRILANTSPEPFSNWFLSISEDIAVFLGLWAAVSNPVFFLVLFVVFICLMIWILPKVFRGVSKIFSSLFRIGFKNNEPESEKI